MPSSDSPLTDLGPRLDALLLHSAGWLVLAAILAALVAWWLTSRHAAVFERIRLALLGSTDNARREPTARKFLRISFGLLWIVDGLLQAQPDMPSGFGRDTLSAGVAASPPWFGDIIAPVARIWTRHPVVADAATVWVQVGIGVLFLVGGTGLLIRFALWTSVAWSLLVWIVGEFAGGLLSPGATWLMGAPGAVLVYLLAAVALIAPWHWWESGQANVFARRTAGIWMLLGAFLQALPWEGSWSAVGLSEPFAAGAARHQPAILRQPISAVATWTALHPIIANALVVALLLAVGVGLTATRATGFVVSGIAVCALTWWLAQDFGVLGGTGTDPNTAFALGLLLVCALPYWQTKTAESPIATTAAGPRHLVVRRMYLAGFAALGIGALVVAPLVVAGLLLGPADSAAVAADSGGGVISVPHRPAPSFALTDQNGQHVSLSTLRGKLTLMTFFDPVCSDDCPLIANQLAIADRQLGTLASRVEIVAIDSNPVFHNVADVAAFTTSHGLTDLPNWHFLAGPTTELQDLIAAYGIVVQVPTVGMIEHGESIYFIGPDGNQQAYLGDGANSALTQSYADIVRDEIRRLLP